jgi:hypothetical protein
VAWSLHRRATQTHPAYTPAEMSLFTKVAWAVAILLAGVVLALSMAARSPADAPQHHLGYAQLHCSQKAQSAATCARPLPYPYRGG